MQENELRRWSYFVFSNITVLPYYVLANENIKKANELLKDIDLKDSSYVALGMQLDLILLTRDKPLLNGLKNRGYRKVMAFEDFLQNI